ncbi:hypothetical protein EV714DRAFT_276512 [Schizophyllum commune]
MSTSPPTSSGSSPPTFPSVSASQSEPRSWQIRSRHSGHYVLGWLATDELCLSVCRRHCPTPGYHKENGEPDTDWDDHIDFLRLVLGDYVTTKYKIDCAGKKVVYINRSRSRTSWAIIVADNQGDTPCQRVLPSPKVVDKIKRFLGTDEEPRWFRCLD